jgi:hypothetical protein
VIIAAVLIVWLIVSIIWSTYMPVPPAHSWRADAELLICLPSILLIVLLFWVLTLLRRFPK